WVSHARERVGRTLGRRCGGRGDATESPDGVAGARMPVAIHVGLRALQGTARGAGAVISHLGIVFMRALAHLPLRLVRALGTALGALLYVVVVPRRRIAMRNLELCFPQWTASQRRRTVRLHFIRFAQAWFDRSWLWHAPADV